MEYEDGFDESRILQGPGSLSVFVPRTAKHTMDPTKDFPPGDPPEVCYCGVTANYWLALRKGRMAYLDGTKVFSDEQMDWLRSIESDVDDLLRKA